MRREEKNIGNDIPTRNRYSPSGIVVGMVALTVVYASTTTKLSAVFLDSESPRTT